jgi:SPX domain protein involved in polyphosphate accumulation
MELKKLYVSDSSAATQLPVRQDSSVESFERVEDKFLVPRQNLPELIELLAKHLDKSYLESETDFNLIESVYFDSKSLKIFRDHFSKAKTRYKLRLRRYAPNGLWPDYGKGVHIEMKSKTERICKKFRLKLKFEQLTSLEKSNQLSAPQKKKMSAQELAADRVREINKTIKTDGLTPICRVQYKRLAFERNNFRVTIDDEIKTELLRPIPAQLCYSLLSEDFIGKAKEMRDRFTSGDFVIVEVKHSGIIPQWLRSYLKINGTTNPVSFSKYCYSMFIHMETKCAL